MLVDLDPESEVPLYKQLADDLRRRIASEGLTRLPSQRTLEQEYGVSLPTVQAAVNLLITEGLVRVSPGKGTFVVREERPAAE
jgi:GntR family transcriptional regulator